MTEIFLTHDWANDELGRNNHERVKKVYHRLTELGVTAWFDEEAMRGDINNTMAAGIDAAQTVGVFITNRYIDKASGKGAAGANDNCKFEVCPPCGRISDSSMYTHHQWILQLYRQLQVRGVPPRRRDSCKFEVSSPPVPLARPGTLSSKVHAPVKSTLSRQKYILSSKVHVGARLQ